jgi:hypothetical protein
MEKLLHLMREIHSHYKASILFQEKMDPPKWQSLWRKISLEQLSEKYKLKNIQEMMD